RRGVLAVAEDRDRRRRHVRPRCIRRPGQLPERRGSAVPQDRRRTRPRRCTARSATEIMSLVAPNVLFIYNEHLATEALLGDAFTDCGFDVETFEVVPADRVDSPAVDVAFPDPTGYDVIVPLGARWPVYDDALRRTWVGAEEQMLRDAADS